MSSTIKPTPRAVLQGIRDMSRGQVPVQPEQIPQHLAHIYLLTERGPITPQLVSGASMVQMYGSRSFDLLDKYTTPNTVLAQFLNSAGNAVMIQRLKPEDAKTANLRLSIEVCDAEVPQTERDINTGQIRYDENGEPILVDEESIQGFRIKWHLTTGFTESEFGAAATTPGTMIPSAGGESQIYPILDFAVPDHGEYGNNVGVRISAPTINDNQPLDEGIAGAISSYLYRFQFVQRATSTSTPVIASTTFGSMSQDLTLAAGKIHPTLGNELSVEDRLIQAYEDFTPGQPAQYGPFGRVHVYQDHLEAVLDKLHPVEAQYDAMPSNEGDYVREGNQALAGVDRKHMLNIFTARDTHGVPYYSIIVGDEDGDKGLNFGPDSTHYAGGGSDGDISLKNFDLMVRHQASNYGNLPEAPVSNTAVYPQSIMYDMGFSMPTKMAINSILGKRRDMAVVPSTQVIYGPTDPTDESKPWDYVRPNDADTEINNAIALITNLKLYPESEIYGTGVCRAFIVGRCGKLINSQYKGYLPLTLDFAHKRALYMGAGNGIWTSGLSYTVSPRNHVTLFRDVNLTHMPQPAYDAQWNNGVIWAQDFDRSRLFYPAFRSVYNDATSVLLSPGAVDCAIELTKVCERVWRQLVGRDDLTEGEFIELSNNMILENSVTPDRFDGKFIIEPDTVITPDDSELGWRWHCNIRLYAANMRLVGVFTIEAHRLDDLAA